ncbi:nucleotidyltransferase family protein [Patescibacteria group bacterium]|nr:nucleotidyltransferase family protein [Patescibacteria group bacterium]MBU4016549.1 nucleotidyltransferase family protein [Patescibacteria group bacterium]MBU4098395.1 nucleotidyltransferase family protein [Patescibacteria group bacterium]
MNKGILEEIKIKALPILRQASVKRAALFGSFVRDEQKNTSDIDLLVDLHNNATLIDLVGLKLDLEKVLKRKVDIVEYAGLKPRIKDSILQQQVTIL